MPEEVGDVMTGTVIANNRHVSEWRRGSQITSGYESIETRCMCSIFGFASSLAKHSSELKMAGFRTAGCSFSVDSVNTPAIIYIKNLAKETLVLHVG